MKRLGILIITAVFLCLTLSLQCEAQSQFTETLTKIEKSLFGIDYNSQNDEQRLKRIEELVYGSASSQPVQTRINKLSKDLSADLIGKEIKPTYDTFADEQNSYIEDIPKADSNINYPVVDNLEESVFGKTFKSNEINQRLSNLEQKVFQKTYNDHLSSRVDRLNKVIAPVKVAKNDEYSDYNGKDLYNYNPNNYNNSQSLNAPLTQKQSPNNLLSGQPSGYSSDMIDFNDEVFGSDYIEQDNYNLSAQLNDLEKKVLKRTYSKEAVTSRLLRLELKVFNSAFTEDDEQTRFARIASAHQAKKSAPKYDGNRFSQHMATAMQVGAFLLMILVAIL